MTVHWFCPACSEGGTLDLPDSTSEETVRVTVARMHYARGICRETPQLRDMPEQPGRREP